MVSSYSEIQELLQEMANGKNFKKGDWFLIMDAHEVISFPQSSALNLTLKETLTRVGQEPYGFNAVALSTFFMQDHDGTPHSDRIPFKCFTLGAWNVGFGQSDHMRPAVDTLSHRVRIWQKTDYPVHLGSLRTTPHPPLCDVSFVGRNVYPYHAQSLRFHPSWKSPFTWLDPALRRMYVLETALGYLASDRKRIATAEYLY